MFTGYKGPTEKQAESDAGMQELLTRFEDGLIKG